MREHFRSNAPGNPKSTNVLGDPKSACLGTKSVNVRGSPKSPNVTAPCSIPLQITHVFSELENDDDDDKEDKMDEEFGRVKMKRRNEDELEERRGGTRGRQGRRTENE